MAETRYTREHEWLRVDGEVGTVGISEHAQEQLGDVVFVELPEIGRHVGKGEAVAVVESVKAASDVYAPAAGEVVEVNDALADDPSMVNSSAESDGWFCRLKLDDASEPEALMDADAYRAYLETLE